ncbi:MAG: hypothetical protein WBE68_21755, partial [Candidatus Nitrosopolaris sp.]
DARHKLYNDGIWVPVAILIWSGLHVMSQSIAHTVAFETRLSTGHENENRTIEQMNHHNGV